MSDVNVVVVTGRLTRDVEVKHLQNSAVANLSLAVNRTWYDKGSGQKREEVAFVDVAVFGKQAENAGQHLSRGSKVLVQGSLKEDRWEDKQSGAKRSRMKIQADQVTYLEFNRGGQSQQQDDNDVPY